MIWLPQEIPHFMMRESMPSSSECCEECNSTACQALLARDETVEPCLHAMSKGSAMRPRPACLCHETRKKNSPAVRAREFCCRSGKTCSRQLRAK